MPRNRFFLSAVLLAALTLPAFSLPAQAQTLDEIVARYTAARGGLPAWRAVQGMEWTGSYATFSKAAPFKLQWQRPGLYRFEGVSLGGPFTWARDAEGPWWIFYTLDIKEPARTEPPFLAILNREAAFEPALLDWQAKGHKVELLGKGDIDGLEVVSLKLTLASGEEETWHLDAKTFLEAVVDSITWDYTQSDKLLKKRSFFMDFRSVGGVMIPHRLEHEYGARFALMLINQATVNPNFEPGHFTMPPAPPAAPAAAESPASTGT